MITLKRTEYTNIDFINLIKNLDAYLKVKDGDNHSFYNQFNNIDILKHVIVAYHNDTPIGCGAIKKFNSEAMEIKRMYVSPKGRGNGTGTKILFSLESWAKELKYTKCVLETGIILSEAVALYKKNEYQIIQNYSQYKDVKNSICFEKHL